MGKRIATTTKDWLGTIPLPVYPPNAKGVLTYAVISHPEIMDITTSVLNSYSLTIQKELYKAPINGQIAQGVYHISGGNDPEIGLMFAWVNSYDKSTKFKCCIGGVINDSGAYCVSGDMGSYIRKHTGNAKQECFNQINDQVNNAAGYYLKLIQDKEQMKIVTVPEKLRAEILGRLLFQDKLLTLEQASVIRAQIMSPKPEFTYNANKDSLWVLYAQIVLALKRGHPKDWLDIQRKTHTWLLKEFGIITVAQPNVPVQVDLIDSIAEVTFEQLGITTENHPVQFPEPPAEPESPPISYDL